MIEHYRKWILGQFEAALWMLHECIEKCPTEHWCGPSSVIGKYEFWHVVHHTLSCTDGYLSRDEHAFQPHPTFHPAGMQDVENEYPSRRFDQSEMLEYVQFCLAKLREMIASETEQTLGGGSGFAWVEISRGELHLYNIRHLMHHTGQLSAFLRRAGAEPRWQFTGWRE
jgi:uncharacterized damage-inducible protein DinB